MGVNDCKIIKLDSISVNEGSLTFIENFDIKRVYYITGVPDGSTRGSHAHKKLWQLITAINGSFVIDIDDGNLKKSITISDGIGLIVVPGIWRTIHSFTKWSVCMVLASEKYDESDYIRNYNEFIEYRNDNSTNGQL